MADSFVADSFTPDKPEPKAEKPEALGPAGKYSDPFKALPGIGGRLMALGQHVVNPQNTAERVQSLGVTAPLFGLGAKAAEALKAAPILGRMAVGGAEAGAGAATRGESAPAIAGKTALGAGTTAAVDLGITKLLGNPGAARMLEKAKAALPKALDAIKGRLWVHPLADEAIINVPSLGGPIKASDAVKRLGELRDESYTAAVDEVRHAMNAIDFSKNAVKAGDAFVARLVKGQKSGVPELFESTSSAKKALTSETARDAAEALANQSVFGIPAGAALPALIPGALGTVGKAAGRIAESFIR